MQVKRRKCWKLLTRTMSVFNGCYIQWACTTVRRWTLWTGTFMWRQMHQHILEGQVAAICTYICVSEKKIRFTARYKNVYQKVSTEWAIKSVPYIILFKMLLHLFLWTKWHTI